MSVVLEDEKEHIMKEPFFVDKNLLLIQIEKIQESNIDEMYKEGLTNLLYTIYDECEEVEE